MLKSPINKKLNQHGVTIIEVIIALAVLYIAIMAIIRIFPTGLQVAKVAEKNTVGAFLAQEKIEELASMPYVDITDITPGTTNTNWDSDSPFYSYSRTTTTSYVDPDDNLSTTAQDLGIIKIETTVSWMVSPEEEKSIFIYTLRSER